MWKADEDADDDDDKSLKWRSSKLTYQVGGKGYFKGVDF
jgi:hypothetical protein